MTELQPGDPVLLRGVHRGRIRWAMPHALVEQREDGVALYTAPGTRGKVLVDRASYAASNRLRDHVWHTHHVLRLTPWGASHSVDLFWEEGSFTFRGWYVNLQAPLRRTPLGFDTTDHDLDLVVEPDGSWWLKDEEELAAAAHVGAFSAEEVRAIHAEAQAAIRRVERRAPPFGDESWLRWRPQAEWPLPVLPPGWDEL